METKNFLRTILFGLLLVPGADVAISQVNYEFLTPQELAVQHLVEPGAVVSNISYFGDSLQFAHLSNLSTIGFGFGLPSAVCMSTSIAPGLIYGFDYPPFLPDISAYTPPWFSGPNHAEDGEVYEDILAVSQETMDLLGFDFMDTLLFDAAWIEFDVIATSDSLTFSYILSGNEFSRSSGCEPGENSWSYAGDCYFHDAFAIFVSGPDITGPYHSPPQFQGSVNVASVPGTNPALPLNTKSVNETVNGNLWIDYEEEYYNFNGCDFYNPCGDPPLLWSWGFTQVLTNSIEVTCGQVYHVRIATADIFDHIYESFWMLAPIGGTANGAQNPEVNVSFVPQGEMVNQVFEDCNPAWLNITRSAIVDINTPDTVFLYPGGIALNGIDYDLLPEYIIIPSGQQTISLALNIVDDGVSESDEILTIAALEAHNLNQDCAISAYVQINDSPDALTLGGSEIVMCNPEATVLEPAVQGGYGQYTYTWYNGSTDPSILVNNPDPLAEYYVIVDDTCGIEADTLWFDLIELDLLSVEFSTDTLDYSCNSNMEVTAEVTGGYGEILYSWSPYNPTSNEETYYFNNADGPQNVYLEVIDGCNQIVTDSVFMYSPFEMPFGYYGDPVISADCGEDFEFVPELGGGIAPYFSYFISGMDMQVGTSATYDITETTLVTILATDACGQNFFTTVTINPFNAGPLNYTLPDMLPLMCNGSTDIEILVEDGFGEIEYEWTDDAGQVLSQSADWTYTGTDELMLYVSASDECGQTMEDSLSLESFYVPLSISVPDSLIVPCAGESSLSVDINNGQGPYEVTWFHNGSVLGSGSVIQDLYFLESTSVEVEVTDGCYNVLSDVIWVEAESQALVVEPLADISLLCGEGLELNVSVAQWNGTTSASWWLNGELLSGTDELILDEVNGAMTIEVMVSDECNQQWQQLVNISTDAGELSIDLPESLELSCADMVTLEPSIVADSEFSVPEWYVDGVYTSEGETFLFNETQSAWVSCYVTDNCGNSVLDSTWISVDTTAEPLIVQPLADVSIVCGDVLNLSLIVEQSNGAYYSSWWSGGQLLSETDELTINDVSGEMSIEVFVSDECGQEWEQVVNVFYDSGELSVDLPESESISCGETVTLEPTIVSDSNVSPASWYLNGTYIAEGNSFLFEEQQSSWLSCEVSDVCGNVAVDSTWILVEVGEMSVQISDTVICIGSTVEMEALVTGGSGQLMYWWNGNTGDSMEEFLVDESTVIEVLVEDECGLSATDEAEIVVIELTPEILIDELAGGYSLTVSDTCPACVYSWSLPDGSSLSAQEIEFYPVPGSDNMVMLEVSDGICIWSGFWHFETESGIYVPNAFTPDGDGVNDVFSVSATGLSDFECIIFDRWGEVICRSVDPSFAWTGNVQGGAHFAPDGVYTWVISAGNDNGESWVKRGSVVLIR